MKTKIPNCEFAMNTIEIFTCFYLASWGYPGGAALRVRQARYAGHCIHLVAAGSLWILHLSWKCCHGACRKNLHGIQWLEVNLHLAFPIFAAVQNINYATRLLFRLSLIVPVLFALLLATDNLPGLQSTCAGGEFLCRTRI